MTFQPNKPERFDVLQDSQEDIQQNFETVNNVFSDDHFPFDDAVSANRGKHKHITYSITDEENENGNLIIPQTADQDVAVYSREVDNEFYNLYIRYQDNGVSIPYSPFANGTLDLLVDNEIEFQGNFLNFDEEKSSWMNDSIVLYFQHENRDINYRVFTQTANQVQNTAVVTQMVVNSKDTEFFTLTKPVGNLEVGQRIFVRVF